MTTSKKKTCFLICPIGEWDSPDRKRSDKLQYFILGPILEDKYKIERADEIPDPGLIPPQIVERLIDDDLVIADLTNCNANVFYELAIRHVTEKPFIHLMVASQLNQKKLPFDNAGMRTIPYPDDFDVAEVKKCQQDITKAVEAVVARPEKLKSPYSITKIEKIAIELKASGDPQKEILARVFDMFQELKKEISQRLSESRTYTIYDPKKIEVSGWAFLKSSVDSAFNNVLVALSILDLDSKSLDSASIKKNLSNLLDKSQQLVDSLKELRRYPYIPQPALEYLKNVMFFVIDFIQELNQSLTEEDHNTLMKSIKRIREKYPRRLLAAWEKIK